MISAKQNGLENSIQSDFTLKLSDLERVSFDHFSEVRRQIDLQREELKAKIDKISLKMIDLLNENEITYKYTIRKSFLAANPVDIEEIRRISAITFRNPNLVINEVQRQKTEHEQKIALIRTRIKEFDSFAKEIKSIVFKPSQEVSFGILKGDKINEVIACAAYKEIIMLDIASNKRVGILEGHSKNIKCLENIGENRFASGSSDNTIRIWGAKNLVCLKTLTGHLFGVFSLKCLPYNRLACGSFGDIKIWNIESGECLQTLNGHSRWIHCLVYLPNGNLVSCSWDKTIKVWDLARGECIKTLASYLSDVNCITLLRNNQLASGSDDKIIKIWNMEIGGCVKTLKGHSNYVWKLLQLESGELVSCSSDNTIKMWDLTEGTCIRTLVGHTKLVRSIRINMQNNTLMSCSDDKTIKTWNLKTGQCVNTIIVSADMRDLILI